MFFHMVIDIIFYALQIVAQTSLLIQTQTVYKTPNIVKNTYLSFFLFIFPTESYRPSVI